MVNSNNNSLRGSDAVHETFGEYDLFIGRPNSNFHSSSMPMSAQFGRNGADFLTGGAMDDDLMGGRGTDVLNGGGGADHLDGGDGSDFLTGGAMDDALRGGDGRDFLDEGDGHGDLEGGRGDDFLRGGRGADAFAVDPTSGHDIIYDFKPGGPMFDHLAIRDIKPEDLRFADTIFGVKISWNNDQGSVLLVGVQKNELAQSDFMFADDRYLLQPTDASADRLTAISFAKDEGGALTAPPAAGNTAAETFDFDDFHVQKGAEAADVMQATGDRDAFFGLGGDDKLFGGANDDHLAGDGGADTLDGGDGMDDLRGGAGNDQLYGGAMADNLMGDDGDDQLFGGGGHDMIDGGAGNDTLNGGDGADAYIVTPTSGRDVVVAGFDAGPGAFDHIAFEGGIMPNQVQVADTAQGALVTWGTSASILLVGITTAQMSQDDFMFSDVEGGGYVNNALIQTAGTDFLFV